MAHMVRGALLSQMAVKSKDKKLKEAEDEFRQALALDPTQASARFSLGFILMRQERDAEGIAELNVYVGLPGADPKTVQKARTIIADPIRAREPLAPDFPSRPLIQRFAGKLCCSTSGEPGVLLAANLSRRSLASRRNFRIGLFRS